MRESGAQMETGSNEGLERKSPCTGPWKQRERGGNGAGQSEHSRQTTFERLKYGALVGPSF